MIKRTVFLPVIAILLATGPVLAQQEPNERTTPPSFRDLVDAVEQLKRSLEQVIEGIPQYGMPRLDKDGNIIVPRLERQRPDMPKDPSRPPMPTPTPPGTVRI